MSNAYTELYKMMGDATPVESPFMFGEIVSPLPKLEVKTNGIVLDKDNLLIDKWLKDRNEELKTEDKGHTHGGDTVGDGNHNHDIKKPIQDKLVAGDKVLLLSISGKYLVLSKVVSI